MKRSSFLYYKFFLFTCALACGVSLQALQVQKPTDNETCLYPDYDSLTLSIKEDFPLQGIVLLPDPSLVNAQDWKDMKGLQLYKMKIPGSLHSLKNALPPLLFGRSMKNLSPGKIVAIKQAIIKYYRDHDHPIVSVLTPPQDVSCGVLRIVIIEGKLCETTVKGNKWFSSLQLEKKLSLKRGDELRESALVKDLYFLNRNPFRNIFLLYTPGAELGSTNIELLVSDRFPLRGYTGIDNAGNDVTGNNRLFVGAGYGNLFGLDQVIFYQYTTSPVFHRFQSHTLDYRIPLPWKHELEFFGGYSYVNGKFSLPNIVGESSKGKSKGYGAQASMRYDIPIKNNDFLHEFFWGFDYKRTNTNLLFGGFSTLYQSVNITQMMAAYNLGYANRKHQIEWEIEGFFSPGRWLPQQHRYQYGILRPYARALYGYSRTTFSWSFSYYRDWRILYYIKGQVATANLLPSEEFGLGGNDSVRGYQERIYNSDYALLTSLELRTDKISLLEQFWHRKDQKDTFEILAFCDLGYGVKHKIEPGEIKEKLLIGIGPGIRYRLSSYLNAKVDWGYQIKHFPAGTPHQRLHFVLNAGY